MKFELKTIGRNASKKELVKEIIRVDSLLGKDKIIVKDFNEVAKITAGSVSRRFGGWEEALTAAGLGHKYSGVKITKKMRQQSKHLTDDQVINELKRIAKKLKQSFISQNDVNQNSEIISGSTVSYRFGSWENGVKKAGLEISPRYKRKISIEEYFENLLNVWTHLGRQPKYAEMKKVPSLISPKAYDNRFGSWRKSLEAFVDFMNSEESDREFFNVEKAESEPIKKEKVETKINKYTANRSRSVSIGLRYKVLSRDRFKCIKCGSSPSTDLNCQLHVDHIVPFSKGGACRIENLQTLCKNCNLGKGDRHIT